MQDTECLKLLVKLRRDTQLTIEELERNKHVLNWKLGEALKRIVAQRAELDRLEKAAITDMLKDDGEYQIFVGTSLEQAIMSTETPALTAAAMKNETSSDMDGTESVEDFEECNLA
jgi:hypothetical protein